MSKHNVAVAEFYTFGHVHVSTCKTGRLRWCNLLQRQQLSPSRHWHDSKSKKTKCSSAKSTIIASTVCSAGIVRIYMRLQIFFFFVVVVISSTQTIAVILLHLFKPCWWCHSPPCANEDDHSPGWKQGPNHRGVTQGKSRADVLKTCLQITFCSS